MHPFRPLGLQEWGRCFRLQRRQLRMLFAQDESGKFSASIQAAANP